MKKTSGIKFKSEFFTTAEELLRAKDEAYTNTNTKRKRLEIVRRFTNMQATMSDKEAEEKGRTEITNHGLTYRAMSQNEAQLTSMVTVTNSLVEVVVDTDNPEQDMLMSSRLSEAINKGAIHHKGRFANFWRKVAGEIVMAGGAPAVFPQKYGWLPKVCPDIMFPPETDLDSENIPYAFDPKELTILDLKNLRSSVKGDDAKYIDTVNIDLLIKRIEDKVNDATKEESSFSYQEISRGTRDSPSDKTTTTQGWWYYEPKWEKGESHVSATLFVQDTIDLKGKSDDSVKVIAYIDKAYEDAAQWVHLICLDSEIGGVKNWDTLKGVAEMTYASSLEAEELFNLTIEGDKIRARPKLRLLDGANIDDVAKLDLMRDLYIPNGLEEMPFKSSSQHLMTPMSILTQNTAGMSGSQAEGQTGKLRVEALESQRGAAMMTTNRLSEAYNHLEAILETVVWRLLAGETKPGTDGYHQTMWVREYLDKYNIDYKKLAERKHGRFVHIRVRANRSVGNGDRVQQIETAKWMMDNLTQFAPQVRPLILRMAVILQTQDPDLAENAVKIPKAIINSQKITAENEFDTIARRAPLGQEIPIAEDDIHQDHIPIHLLDMQALTAAHDVRPWDKLDVLTFAGLARHVGEHLGVLMSNKATNSEAVQFIQPYQQITQSAQAIVQEVEEREGSEQAQLPAKDQADIQLKWARYELDARKMGLDIEKQQRLWKASEARQATIRRGQFTKEIDNDRRFGLDEKRIEIQASAKKAVAKKTAKPKTK